MAGSAVNPNWRSDFLTTLARTGSVNLACRVARVSTKTVYTVREKDYVFRKEWTEALRDAVGILEVVAWDRALRHSDTLLMFLLRAYRPDLFIAANAGNGLPDLSKATKVKVREVIVEIPAEVADEIEATGEVIDGESGAVESNDTLPGKD